MNGICGHTRALTLFEESIRVEISKNCSFLGQPWNLNDPAPTQPPSPILCDGPCPEMGINADRYNYSDHKTFYVSTDGIKPICVN